MLMLVKIAITGGLSCGKSSFCRFLRDHGAHVVNADEVVHQLLRSPHTTIGKQVVALLGADIVVNDSLDRQAIAKKVFTNSTLLSSLEKILHPAVAEEVERQYQQLYNSDKNQEQKSLDNKSAKKTLFVSEAPLLFEVDGEKKFQYTVAVIAPEDECIKRFIKATGQTEAEFKRRMARQLPQEEKGRRADFTIENKGSLEDLQQAAATFYRNILNQ
jgi:dephospho-CoA kinase